MSFIRDHVLCAFRTQTPEIYITRVPDFNLTFLTALTTETCSSVPILEEIVQSSAVLEDVGTVDDAEAPCAYAIGLGAVRKGGIIVSRVWRKCCDRIRIALPVRRFMLNDTHEDVRRVRYLVVIERRVLSSSCVHPYRAVCTFNEKASGHIVNSNLLGSRTRKHINSPAIVDVDLIPCAQVELMIGNPAPSVFQVDVGLRCDMKQHECSLARSCTGSGCCQARIFQTFVHL